MRAALAFVFCLVGLLAQAAAFTQSDDLAAKSQRAKEFMVQGKYTDAIPLYRELNQAVPNNPGLLLNLGMALHMSGDERASLAPLTTAARLDPQLTPAWLFLGAARLELGQTSAGIDALKAVLRLQPGHPDALEMLGRALLSVGRVAEAAEQYQKLAAVEPASAPAWYGLGRSYEALSNRAFDALQKSAPESAYSLALIAETRLREKQFSSAFYLYRRAIEKTPSMAGLHAGIAEVYRQTGHADWAAVEEEKERQIPQSDCASPTLACRFRQNNFTALLSSTKTLTTPESNYWRARAYNEMALQAFTRLGELAPSPEQHEVKAHILTGQKRYADAAQEWREALKLSPSDKQIQKQLAISLKFGQDYAQALPIFQDLLKAQPASPELNYLTGETLLDLQRVEEAVPLLKRAVIRDPKLLPAHKALARAYLAAGEAAEAIPHLRAALSTDEDGSLHYQLARAYQMTGRVELSKQVLAEYQQMQRVAVAEKSAGAEIEITPP